MHHARAVKPRSHSSYPSVRSRFTPRLDIVRTAVRVTGGYGPVAGMPVYGSPVGAGTSRPQRASS